MRKFYVYLFIVCFFPIGCAAFLAEQQYILVDDEVKETMHTHGRIFSIPREKDIRKIVILGEGTVTNIEIYVRQADDNWRSIKKITRTVAFPIEIKVALKADAVRIIQKRVRGMGRINTVQFYTIAQIQQ